MKLRKCHRLYKKITPQIKRERTQREREGGGRERERENVLYEIKQMQFYVNM